VVSSVITRPEGDRQLIQGAAGPQVGRDLKRDLEAARSEVIECTANWTAAYR
jgi:hypothetical protein